MIKRRLQVAPMGGAVQLDELADGVFHARFERDQHLIQIFGDFYRQASGFEVAGFVPLHMEAGLSGERLVLFEYADWIHVCAIGESRPDLDGA